MEKKTTQRIIGILIAISLVIILMPLLFNKNEGSSDMATVSAPPLPDQPKLAATDSSSSTSNTTTTTTTPSTSSTTSDSTTIASSNTSTTSPDQTVESTTTPTPDNNPAATIASANNISTPSADVSSETQAATIASLDQTTSSAKMTNETIKTDSSTTSQSVKTPDQHADAATKNLTQPIDTNAKPEPQEPRFSVISNPVQTDTATNDSDIKTTTTSHKAIDEHNHLKSKHVKNSKNHVALNKMTSKKAWAVQMGCFKDKNNALRLTEKLHAAGYKAFTREIKSAKGNMTTRVFIGPEFKQASAEKLTSQLEQEMKIRGIIVSYQHLEG